MKGWLRILEAVIASVALLAFLFVFFQVPKSYDHGKNAELTLVAEQTILVLDRDNNFLRKAVQNGEFESIRERTREMLPSGYMFAYKVGGYEEEIPPGVSTVNVNYVLSFGDEFEIVRFYIWTRT